MIEAGPPLSSPDDKEAGSPYDRFRGRVMFPILDKNGRVIAFGDVYSGGRVESNTQITRNAFIS